MGIQFYSRIAIPHTHLKMKFLIALCLVASAMALEDTADVKAAKASFTAAFTAAETGAHASLAPAPVASSYLPDSAEVAAYKAGFAAAFAAAETGAHANLAPAPVASSYLADSAVVAMSHMLKLQELLPTMLGQV